MGTTEKLLVSVRLRPLNEKEIARNDVSDWECLNENSIIFKNNHLPVPVPERSMYPTVYTFDRVFRSNSSTKQVYEEGAKEVALSVVSGINSTVFAYGQTSSGKTYTMTGITEFTVADIYDYMEKFSAMEIYNESVRDLLSTDSTPLRLLDDPERGTVVEKLTEEPVGDWNHLMELLSFCEAQRQIGETALNETSSRSHQIIRLTIESSAREFLSKDSSTLAASVNFVDLAGSERASQSLSAGTRLKEGCHINRSLLTLGTVIRKLSKGRIGHIPFRDSKLTRILQSSLGGNARTAIICTMSPARSHIEQSRNTLLFASCAKEVTTNAQVNVFMSDKALVKHLQRELARLETELRSPVSTFPVSHYSALLREKDLHIEKLEKEIIDLILQRDVAQSQIQDLLRLVGDDCDSMKSVGLNNYPHLRVQRSPECENPKSGTSPLVANPHSLDVGVISFDRYLYSDGHSQSSSDDHYIQLPDFEQDFQQNDTSLQLLVNTSKFITSNSVRSWGGIEEKTNGTSEDLCKEVRCIETEESSTDQHSISNRSSAEENAEILELTMDGNGDITGQEYVSLSLKEDRELSYVPLFVAPPEKPSAWPLTKCMQSSQKLTKSRSCKASLTTSPSSQWFENIENNENTPPNGSEKDFPGRPEGIRRKLNELNHGADVERLLRKDSQSSVGSAAAIELEAENEKTLTDDNITKRTNACVSELEDKAELQEEKPADDDGPVHEAVLKVMESLKNVKDVGLDPIEGDSTSLSNWPTEFKRLQTEIIGLWDDCNVSLVHRTYFFLLFKGEPTDSIYMEVELRRLSFLKDTFSRGSKTIEEGRTLSPASSRHACTASIVTEVTVPETVCPSVSMHSQVTTAWWVGNMNLESRSCGCKCIRPEEIECFADR
ncbi:ATP binding microtubule motor family protein [Actinidia rufa]|uniref:Kinesin-like protein n=1 Tax=Actinidia rufa TaxID=165716 RepID=A0A7J0ENX9_9ERIC|nr:ATP binding microtubule motor family protein [Actinidia rufa]